MAEDLDTLSDTAAKLAIDRGYPPGDAANYAFALASMMVNSVFAGNFPEPSGPPTHRLHAV
ncbi:hypothetical protein [Pseudonocardia sp. 73-21]|uniref:hypothetical protein n=1 Tax=Pseudonocardia sp. 73-21 TaxID=1895809 RepID=UPI0026358C27|nr:hypothetical protein [Pseudonocardia sp. 73-21]